MELRSDIKWQKDVCHQGLPVVFGECSKMHSKCMYCDGLERAVSHTSTNSSREMSCTIINFIVPLLLKTDRVSFCKTV